MENRKISQKKDVRPSSWNFKEASRFKLKITSLGSKVKIANKTKVNRQLGPTHRKKINTAVSLNESKIKMQS